jgi:hypothetical protein
MKITGVRPWLVKASTSYWGEYLFVEVTPTWVRVAPPAKW